MKRILAVLTLCACMAPACRAEPADPFLQAAVAVYKAYEEAKFRDAAFTIAWKDGGRMLGLEQYQPFDLAWLPYGFEQDLEGYPEACAESDPDSRCPLAGRQSALRALDVKASYWAAVGRILDQVEDEARGIRLRIGAESKLATQSRLREQHKALLANAGKLEALRYMLVLIEADIAADRDFLQADSHGPDDVRRFKARKLGAYRHLRLFPWVWNLCDEEARPRIKKFID